MAADYEAYIVVIGTRDFQRYADRHVLHVPVDLARGRLEDLSDLQVREALRDLLHEFGRRMTGDDCPVIPELREWTPELANIREAL